MNPHPIQLQTITDVQNLLARLEQAKLIRVNFNNSHCTIEDLDPEESLDNSNEHREAQSHLSEQFLVAEDGETYLLADIEQISDVEAENITIMFPTKNREQLTFKEVKNKITAGDTADLPFNQPLAEMLKTIWFNSKDIMLQAPRSSHFNLFMPIIFPIFEFNRAGGIFSEEAFGVYKHLNVLFRSNIALRDLIWLNFKNNQQSRPALQYRLNIVKDEQRKKKLKARLRFIDSAFMDYQVNLNLQHSYLETNLQSILELKQACVDDLQNKTKFELQGEEYQRILRTKLSLLRRKKREMVNKYIALSMTRLDIQNKLNQKDTEALKYLFPFLIFAWVIGHASGFLPALAESLSTLTFFSVLMALQISVAAGIFISIRATLRQPFEVEIKKMNQEIQANQNQISDIETRIKNIEKQLEIIPQILLNLVFEDETLSTRVNKVDQLFGILETRIREFSVLHDNRVEYVDQDILTIPPSQQNVVDSSVTSVSGKAQDSHIEASLAATSHSSQASEYGNYARLPPTKKAKFTKLFKEVNTHIDEHLDQLKLTAASSNRHF